MINIINQEIITDAEWFRRLIEDKEYVVLQFDWDKGITRVIEKETGKMFDVSCESVGKRTMLKVVEVK